MADSASKLLDLMRNKKRNLSVTTVYRKPNGVTTKVSPKTIPTPQSSSSPVNRVVKANGSRQPSSSISRQSSREPKGIVKHKKPRPVKVASPSISTPIFTDSDNEEDPVESRKKRPRLERRASLDKNRQIRNPKAFLETDAKPWPIAHAATIANSETQINGRYTYGPFFTALSENEDECPTIELRYPSATQTERYQLVRPVDSTDFRPLSEIIDNMKVMAEYFLDESTAEKVTCPEDGSGIVERLQKVARDGDKKIPGSQTKFVELVERYNNIIIAKRKDGTIAKRLDEHHFLPLKVAEHIVKEQVYARTVSPQVHLVRQYEGFSSNVYGELLPRFLSEIFKLTHLKSDQVFVDLGSGVGNCVLQAALETGAESWGCEMMKNCSLLADAQLKEFTPRCRMWGIKPGRVRLIADDFLTNEMIRGVLKRADVVLINNQAFQPELNDNLKYIFLDLKEGCQIISLKPFRDPSHKIKDTNVHDPVNVLRVEERDRFSGMVSWTDDPGKWYLQTKDSSELKAFEKRNRR